MKKAVLEICLLSKITPRFLSGAAGQIYDQTDNLSLIGGQEDI